MYDFTSEYIAEYIYDFLFDNDLLDAPASFEMSMLEFVSCVCPVEFADYLGMRGVDASLYIVGE